MNTPPRPVGPAYRNAPTWSPRIFGGGPPAAPAPVSLATAFAAALRVHRTRPQPLEPAYCLYWMTTAHFNSRVIDGASHFVVGRHTACDGVLEGDESIALRHLLVRSAVLDDGCPRLSILDLETERGFVLPDGTIQRSVSVTGPLAFRVGAYALVALPSEGNLPEEMPTAVPVRPDAPAPDKSQRPLSRVTLLPRALMLADRPTMAIVTAEHRHEIAHDYELALEAASGRVSVFLSAGDLARGVLVGRATKCLDAGLRTVLNLGISRVHLLLLRDGSECRAYDIASTQGTLEAGRLVRQVRLDDEGTRLELGTSTGIRLTWRAVGTGRSEGRKDE
jgi:hypothetical protein